MKQAILIVCVAVVVVGMGSIAMAAQLGDANLDDVVDIKDFATLRSNFGYSSRAWADGDFNSDTTVDLKDFGILKDNFGLSFGPGSSQSLAATAIPSLWLLIDENTDQAWLKNTSAAPLQLTGYIIMSVGGHLEKNEWESISDAAVTRRDDVIAQLGVGALTFDEGDPDLTTFVGEINIFDHALFQPGASWSIGKPAPGASLADLSFQYTLGDGPVHDGGIELVPEPATLGMLALGGLAVLRRRKSSILTDNRRLTG
jgi:hypothetical protein